MNVQGVLLGILSFLIIGIWHPIVIKGEYHFGRRVCALVFAVIGVVCIVLSLLAENAFVSVAAALFGFSALWGVREVREQEERVKRGWFPKKPGREAPEADGRVSSKDRVDEDRFSAL